jgi:hypothetical protein
MVRKMNLLELFWSLLQNNANHFGSQIKISLLKHFFWITKYSKALKSPEVNHFYFYVRS